MTAGLLLSTEQALLQFAGGFPIRRAVEFAGGSPSEQEFDGDLGNTSWL
jgi:hypothetical protein